MTVSNPFLIDENKGKEYVLQSDQENRIGRGTSPRAENITISLLNETVSANHAIIKCESGRWAFVDSESTHGSKVNGIAVKKGAKVFLNHGDMINIGEYNFKFFDENTIAIGGTKQIPQMNREALEDTVQKFDWREEQSTLWRWPQKEKNTNNWQDEQKKRELEILTYTCIILVLVIFMMLFFGSFFEI